MLPTQNLNVYRWCDDYGGGLVVAESIEDASEKLQKKYKAMGERNGEFTIWLWENDDYYDEDNPFVYDIYD